MSKVQIDNISVENPKAAPADTIRLAVTFSALTALPHSLTWRLTYVGSAFSEDHDQLLEEFEIGPIAEASTMSFTVEVDPPALDQVPREELLCTTAMIMSVAYLGQEFARIGYYVLNTYRGEAEDTATLPLGELLAHTDRIIIHEKPRVTKFDIKWEEQQGKGEERASREDRSVSAVREQEVREQKESLGELREVQELKSPLKSGNTPQRAETDA